MLHDVRAGPSALAFRGTEPASSLDYTVYYHNSGRSLPRRRCRTLEVAYRKALGRRLEEQRLEKGTIYVVIAKTGNPCDRVGDINRLHAALCFAASAGKCKENPSLTICPHHDGMTCDFFLRQALTSDGRVAGTGVARG